ncbi:MAG TPA: Gfo/Idh/MocA family oxidoreductase [Thermomicrobiales bacterium]|nr:Gfo/Idh/MocA family oxidoreductase [Thermomicrobiales bacterium]
MSGRRIRVGVLGLTHDHIWKNLENLVKLDSAELVGVAEPDAALREQFRQRFGDLVIVDDFDALLDGNHDLQAVFAFSDNRTSAELGARAADRGLHVMLEKPMASTLELADRLLTAGKRNGVQVMVNWPHFWNPNVREAHRLAHSGAIGDIFKLRYAGGHAGPREIGCSPIFCDWLYDADLNGVGALIDQGGYATTVCRWFLGRPNRVVAMGGRLTKEDEADLDNIAILLRYDRAIAIAEASWSWIGGWPTAGPLVYGTEGTIAAHGLKDPMAVALVTKDQKEPRVLDVPPLPQGQEHAPAYFISSILNDQPIDGLVSAAVSRDAQEIMDAAIESIRTGHEVSIPRDARIPGIS